MVNNYTLCDMKKLFLLLLFAAFLTGCNGGADSDSASADNSVEVRGDTLVVDQTSALAQRLECGVVSDTTYAATLTTTGVVSAIPSAYAEVAAPFSGRVVRSLVRIGQRVKAGTPLFEISSSDYAEVVKRLNQTKSEIIASDMNPYCSGMRKLAFFLDFSK